MTHKVRMPTAYRIAIAKIMEHSSQIADEIQNTNDIGEQLRNHLVLVELKKALQKLECLLIEIYERERMGKE